MLVMAQFVTILDAAIVNVALPSIQADLGFSQEDLQWVVTSYTILFGGVLLLGGRLADLRGRRRLFITGMTVFTAASLFNGLAWNDSALIVGRAIQGLGAALLVPAALSVLVTIFPEGRERNRALGIWAGATAEGSRTRPKPSAGSASVAYQWLPVIGRSSDATRYWPARYS